MAGTLTVQNIQGPASGANANKIIIPSGQTLDASAGFVPPAGSVVQVIVNTKTDVASFSPAAGVFVNMFDASITPLYSTSKILVMCDATLHNISSHLAARFTRNGTPVGIGDAAGSRLSASTGGYYNSDGNVSQNGSISFFDAPNSTSLLTYTLQAVRDNEGNPIHINRSHNDSDNNVGKRCVTTITLMEITQ